ncbi:MAG: Ig-like domain-containing protein [Oscillospiraceae bacterium]|nr:Ig-like domain-containing protein [Oscillospiraceae bacterium]MBQ7129498.1 Ig-like domain-containing protein [Oscillospiraceae bacterium]
MEKVVCDICGTIYPDSEDKCPTCGCSRDFGLDNMEEEFLTEGILEEAVMTTEPRKKSKVFDFDEVNDVTRSRNQPEEDDYDEEEEEEDEDQSRTNVGLVVVLLILIVLLLATAGFFFVRYFLPNMTQPEETTPVVTTLPTETVPVQTTELTIPCVNLSVPGGKIELGEGGKWLMNVQVFPKDTTDTLTYSSSDESVVTVNESGTVTAVGEGTAQIIVTCGDKKISTNVVVDYSAGVETIATETIPALEVDTEETEETGETTDGTTEATEATEAAGETQPQESTDATEFGELVVKLKKSDISIFARYTSVTLELDCDLELTDLTWFTMDSTVAIVHDGVITATGSGITRIYGDYGDQRVECIVRCSF